MKQEVLTLYIRTTYHNMFVSILKKNSFNSMYNIIKTFSCGMLGFKNKAKSTSFAFNLLINKSCLYILEQKYIYVHIIFKGVNIFKKIILNTIANTKLNCKTLKILSIKDITSYPHNGCKSKKLKKR